VGALCATLAVTLHFGRETPLNASLTTNMHTSSLAVLVLLCIVAHKVFGDWDDKRGRRIARAFGLLFGAAEVLGNTLHVTNALNGLFATGALFFKTLVAFAGFAYLGTVLAAAAMRGLDKLGNASAAPVPSAAGSADDLPQKPKKLPRLRAFVQSDRGFFLVVWGILILSRLPYFLAFYPGVTSYDSDWQLKQTLGIMPYSDHHPIFHTLLIGAVTGFGEIVGLRMNTSVALFSVLQILVTTAVFAYALTRMRAWGCGKGLRVVSLLFMALFPIHAIYSVTMWKDVPFGTSILLLSVVLIDVAREKRAFFVDTKTNAPRMDHFILLTLSLLAVALLRNNGRYVAALTIFILFIALRPVRWPMFAVGVSCLVLFAVIMLSIFGFVHFQSGSRAEMLSVPMQQFARIAKEYPESLSAQQVDFLRNLNAGDLDHDGETYADLPNNELPTIQEIGERYNPTISDPVKWFLNDDYFEKNLGRFLLNWVVLCLQHPGTALTAFLNNNYGYWTVIQGEWGYWSCFSTIYGNDYGLAQESKFPAFQEYVGTHYDLINYNKTPGISLLYSQGVGFWILLLCAALLLWKKRGFALGALVPLFVLWLTCLASPVHGEYRYFYGIVCALPAVIGFTIEQIKRKEFVIAD
jgi:hypothetical protein